MQLKLASNMQATKNNTVAGLALRQFVTVVAVFITVIAVFMLNIGWMWGGPRRVTNVDFLMSTMVEVIVYNDDEDAARDIIRMAFDEAKRIEHIMEARIGDGEMQRINSTAGRTRWTISPELAAVLKRSEHFYRLTDGMFDPTIAPVKWLWDFEGEGRLPPENEIREQLAHVGYDKVKVHGTQLEFSDDGVKLDLGGVAKGYAVDRMIDVLKRRGIKAGLVNAGGDIVTFGKKPGKSKLPFERAEPEDWKIAVRHPRMNRQIEVKPAGLPAVATSGDYERYFMKNGIRYHHILDPRTGYPASRSISVTVWTSTAMDADILATAIFVLGPEKGIELAERLENVEALVFYENDDTVRAVASSGIESKLPQSLFEQ